MKKHSAFTLIELMVTIAIAGVLLAIAIPGFGVMISNNRLTTQANDFVAAASFARSEAIKRGAPVTICRSNNGSTCGTGTGWESGWIVFADRLNPGTRDSSYDSNCGAVDAATQPVAECVLRSKGAFGNATNTLRGDANVSDRITFTEQGMSPGFNGTLTVCDTSRRVAREVAVTVTGRMRIPPTQATCS